MKLRFPFSLPMRPYVLLSKIQLPGFLLTASVTAPGLFELPFPSSLGCPALGNSPSWIWPRCILLWEQIQSPLSGLLILPQRRKFLLQERNCRRRYSELFLELGPVFSNTATKILLSHTGYWLCGPLAKVDHVLTLEMMVKSGCRWWSETGRERVGETWQDLEGGELGGRIVMRTTHCSWP